MGDTVNLLDLVRVHWIMVIYCKIISSLYLYICAETNIIRSEREGRVSYAFDIWSYWKVFDYSKYEMNLFE